MNENKSVEELIKKTKFVSKRLKELKSEKEKYFEELRVALISELSPTIEEFKKDGIEESEAIFLLIAKSNNFFLNRLADQQAYINFIYEAITALTDNLTIIAEELEIIKQDGEKREVFGDE